MFVGVTRFSVFRPYSSEWVISKDIKDDNFNLYRDKLLNLRRLQERCAIFIDISIPLLAKMAVGYDYIHIVQYSDLLPDEFKSKLHHIAKLHHFIRLQEVPWQGEPKENFYDIIMTELNANNHKIFGLFNLDDDDLLSVDYFKQSSSFLTEQNVGYVVSFGFGLTALFSEGVFSNIREVYLPKINIGQLKICRYTKGERSFTMPKSGNHMYMDRYSPIILDSREISFLWIRHLDQDTSANLSNDKQEIQKIIQDMDNFPLFNDKPLISSKFGEFLPVESTLNSELKIFSKDDNEGVLLTSVLKSFDCTFDSGNWVFAYEIECGSKVKSKGVLMAFEFLGDINRFRLVEGVLESPQQDIGFYRYIIVKPGYNKGSVSINIPSGVKCSKVKIREWYAEDSVFLHSIVALSSQSV